MKTKPYTIIIPIISVIIILIGTVYFRVGLPALNFLYNRLPETGTTNPSVWTKSDGVIDTSAYKKTQTDPNWKPYVPSTTPAPEQKGTFGETRQQTYVDFALPANATNILVLGLDEAAGLTDTIFVVSIDEANDTIRIISLPRDTYVRYTDSVINKINEYGWEQKGIHKLNISFLIGQELLNYRDGELGHAGVDFLSAVIEAMLGESFHIDDYMFVDFDGFMEMVNVFGGIWMTVDQTIYNQYGQMLVPAGRNFLSPKEALFYVRTRKIFDEHGNATASPGDSYRKELQVRFIKEMLQQYVTTDSISHANEILTKLRESVYHSIDAKDLKKYLKIAEDFNNKKYFVDFLIITGEDIDPFNDDASYVEIVKTN